MCETLKKGKEMIIESIFSILTIALPLRAEEWLCKEAASIRNGPLIQSCGIGTGKDENHARLAAFDNAKAEFERICLASDDCKNRTVSVEPERTSCTKEKSGYKCYRMLTFEISRSTKQGGQKASTKSPDVPDAFIPFRIEDVAHLPRLRKGMTKKELLEKFGAPFKVDNYYWYRGEMCIYSTSTCLVKVQNGAVTSWDDFKPIYTEDLE